MTDQHPITPPPELVEQWRNLPEYVSQLRTMSTVTITTEKLQDIATQAARWGADTELEACCDWLRESLATPSLVECFLAARRPKPPSLKEQALEILGYPKDFWSEDEVDTIRRALEALPE